MSITTNTHTTKLPQTDTSATKLAQTDAHIRKLAYTHRATHITTQIQHSTITHRHTI